MATHFRTNHYILSAFSEIKLLYLCTNAWQPIQKDNLPITSTSWGNGGIAQFLSSHKSVMAIQQVKIFQKDL